MTREVFLSCHLVLTALFITSSSSLKMMFRAIGKPAKFVYVPTQVFDLSISMIELFAKIWPSPKWKDVLETARIGKYYAVEDMLTTEEEEQFGSISMMDHFERIARDGQDPFTPVYVSILSGLVSQFSLTLSRQQSLVNLIS